MAYVFLEQLKRKGWSFSSLNGISSNLDYKIYNVESNGALHNYLKYLNDYVCSEYFGDYETYGEEVGGVLNVDLMDIPFESNTLDYILSTEVFEHIPDPYKAFSEIHRILKIGGSHIFTVPYYSDREFDEVRSVLNQKNEIVHLMEPQYHGDPIRSDEGILVYTIFAKEMHTKLEALGFEVEVDFKRSLKSGVLGGNNIVFIATKCSHS